MHLDLSNSGLDEAVQKQDEKRVKALLKVGHHPDTYTDSKGSTAIHIAATQQKTDTLKLLIDAGGSLNAKNNNNFGPIHIVAQNGNYEAI